jgi:hypothetical protein
MIVSLDMAWSATEHNINLSSNTGDCYVTVYDVSQSFQNVGQELNGQLFC